MRVFTDSINQFDTLTREILLNSSPYLQRVRKGSNLLLNRVLEFHKSKMAIKDVTISELQKKVKLQESKICNLEVKVWTDNNQTVQNLKLKCDELESTFSNQIILDDHVIDPEALSHNNNATLELTRLLSDLLLYTPLLADYKKLRMSLPSQSGQQQIADKNLMNLVSSSMKKVQVRSSYCIINNITRRTWESVGLQTDL